MSELENKLNRAQARARFYKRKSTMLAISYKQSENTHGQWNKLGPDDRLKFGICRCCRNPIDFPEHGNGCGGKIIGNQHYCGVYNPLTHETNSQQYQVDQKKYPSELKGNCVMDGKCVCRNDQKSNEEWERMCFRWEGSEDASESVMRRFLRESSSESDEDDY